MASSWKCPSCERSFRQINQRHSCGVGDESVLLSGKPQPLVRLYRSLARELSAYPGVEIVARDRYALFRTTRVFADLVFMRDALRLAVHLQDEQRHPPFFKVVCGENGRVAHVAKLCHPADLEAVMPYVRMAYDFAQSESLG